MFDKIIFLFKTSVRMYLLNTPLSQNSFYQNSGKPNKVLSI